MYDLNQKTMQALGRLAEVYATFEDTWANVETETAESDLLFQHQARFQEELKSSRESFNIAFREFNNCRALHDAACVDLEDTRQRTIELKRKADDAHERTRSHRERCRRATKDHMRAEEVLINSLGCLGELVRDTASATHALSCGVPDRVTSGKPAAPDVHLKVTMALKPRKLFLWRGCSKTWRTSVLRIHELGWTLHKILLSLLFPDHLAKNSLIHERETCAAQ